MRENLRWPASTLIVALSARPASAARGRERSLSHGWGRSTVQRTQYGLLLRWPIGKGETGQLSLDLRPKHPLISHLGTAGKTPETVRPVVTNADPEFWVTVGTRGPGERPLIGGPFNVFFDNPAQRPSENYLSHWADPEAPRRARVISDSSVGSRTRVVIDGLAAGPFTGSLEITTYAGSGLIRMEAALATARDRTAYYYDAGLLTATPHWSRLAWVDPEGRFQNEPVQGDAEDRALMVRHRTLIAEGADSSLACFPAPHQYFFPRDYTDNLQYVWAGRNHRNASGGYGFGIRQTATGGGNYSPWVNAPPGSRQRMSVFYLLHRGPAREALAEVLRYTHEDRFVPVPGFRTYTGHYHLANTVVAMAREAAGGEPTTPEFVPVFKNMGVEIVHTAEFHGDGHQKDPGPLRLPELAAMFRECRRLSDDGFLLLPGEEVDEFLGRPAPDHPSGHWMSLFPRPVFWTMRRPAGTPFVTEEPRYGTVYHVGNREELVDLLQRERGLVWTAHPRIKASIAAPDAFRTESFFHSESWLGAAWKAMPADLSQERLGKRALDLMDDLANWGERKYVPGEVDVFKIDHTHELYGHMNINYVRLDRVPRFDAGWQPLLDALRRGRFWTTTGEVLLPEWSVGGKRSGETLHLQGGSAPEVRVGMDWTFPLQFAEVISGDGERVYRERINLADTASFGKRTLTLHPDLRGRKWVRVEVWDVAANGAFTQPVWLEP